MKFETLKQSKIKYYIIGGVLLIGVLGILIVKNTFSKYRTTQSINIVNGTINYTLGDINIIALYTQNGSNYEEVSEVPESGYTFNSEESYCTVDGIKQDVEMTYDLETKAFSVGPYTEGKMKCYLYFDTKPITIPEIVASLDIKTTTPDFSAVATTDEGVYAVADGMYGGTSYYWRGAVTNNYVTFAGFCWRIIRINGDGTMRLIYDGESCHANGTETTDSIAVAYQMYNSSDNSPEYIGWSYTLGEQHGNSTLSDARSGVESWYTANLENYESYIVDGYFCNDREISEEYTDTDNIPNYYYAAYKRLLENMIPSLNCNNENDIFITKIGLITADEVSYAGGNYGTNNTSYYLYNGQCYWTMTPFTWNSFFLANVFSVSYDSSLVDAKLEYAYGLRPVINLKADTQFQTGGLGTIDAPYVVI